MHARMLVQTILLLLLLNVAAPARGENSTAQSGCQVCADTGDCARAFRGGPGQFCGNWLDRTNARQSCCCPTDAVCRVTNYACNCAYANRGGDRYGYGDGYGDSRGYGSALEWLWWLLGSLLVLFCCSGLLFMVCRRRRQDDAETPMAYATAEPTPPTYGAYGSTPSAPVYAAQPVYGGAVPGSYAGGGVVQQPVYSGVGRSGGGMSAGAGAALGGGAGLLGGLLLGEAIADAGRSDYGGGGFDGGGVAADGFDGGGGGGDFGGDF